MEDMQKWQQENKEQRSVVCVATDLNDTHSSLMGYPFPLVMALLANMLRDDSYAELVKAAYLVKKNPLMLGTLLEEWAEFKKEHGWPMDEGKEPENKEGVKSFLKDLFKTIADKL